MIWPVPGRRPRASPRRENPGHLVFLQPCSAAPIKSISGSSSAAPALSSQLPSQPGPTQTSSNPLSASLKEYTTPSAAPHKGMHSCSPHAPERGTPSTHGSPSHSGQRQRWKRSVRFPSDTNNWGRVRDFSHAHEQQVPEHIQPSQTQCPMCLQLPSR